MSSLKLLSPLSKLGLSHRICMAPLTRVRGTETFACGENAIQYYSERATKGGLLISEGVPISPETQYEYAAGIYTPEQEAHWKKVVDAVHAKGGKISIQLWHLGRMVHGSWSENPYLKSLGRPLPTVSASATTAPGASRDYVLNKRGVPYTQARELKTEEIKGRLVQDFKAAAEAALRCGFDFAEIHGAHGYLFDQFLNSTTNLRTDEFGSQNIENRTRALFLVLEAVIGVFGPNRVALRMSPTYKDSFAYQGCQDSEPQETYRSAIALLSKKFSSRLAYLLITEPRWNGGRNNLDVATDPTFDLPVRNGPWVKQVYDGIVIGSSSFTPITAEQAISKGYYDAIAFGRLFISNPDLVYRIQNNLSLNVYNTATFYVRDQVLGYVDYPTYQNKKDFPQIAADQMGKKKPESQNSKL